MVTNYQNGVIAQLLQAIIGQINFDGTPTSNIGDILLSILEQTPYDKEPKSVLAELFLKLKDKLEGRAFTPYDKEPKSAIAEILLSILNETEYDKEPNSRIAELLLELKAELESYAELTASGAIANFTTSVVKPLINLTAYFNATQEAGTPTPQSPKAISGVSAVSNIHCHKNLYQYDESKVKTGTTTAQSIRAYLDLGLKGANQFTISANIKDGETPTNTNINISKIRADGLIEVLLVFILSGNPTPTARTITINQGESLVFTMASNNPNTALANIPKYDYQIEIGTVQSEYEPYNGSTTLINLGGTYYGGYVTQDKDGHRQFEVTHGIKLFGDISFSRSNNGGAWGAYLFYAQITDKTNGGVIKCSNYEYVIQATSTMQNEKIISTGSSKYIYVRDDAYTTVADFKTANANTQLVYPLATPIIIDLPDGEPITAFNGVNNVYNDSGDTSVTYLAKIADNLNATAKFRAEVKAQKEKAKEELKEDVKEDVKELEPIKDSGEKKRGA